MKITLIASVDANFGIGYKNQLLAHISADLMRFKALTQGNTIVMGSKTWASLPRKPLPNRQNWILSRQMPLGVLAPYENTLVFNDIQEILQLAKSEKLENLFIIGGAEVYSLFFEQATHLELTHIEGNYTDRKSVV